MLTLCTCLPEHIIINHQRGVHTLLYTKECIAFLRSDAAATIFSFLPLVFLWLLFEGGVYLFWKPANINGGWIRCTSDTAMTVRLCQYFAQPLSPAVIHGNKSYNTNSPSTSLVTVVRKYSHTCVCRVYYRILSKLEYPEIFRELLVYEQKCLV